MSPAPAPSGAWLGRGCLALVGFWEEGYGVFLVCLLVISWLWVFGCFWILLLAAAGGFFFVVWWFTILLSFCVSVATVNFQVSFWLFFFNFSGLAKEKPKEMAQRPIQHRAASVK